ncbi:hypothetical protein [Mycobacterium haemophilum]|nr:hypothetical protein [Mycobacterium haemophilum]
MQSSGQANRSLTASDIVEPHEVSDTITVDVEFEAGIADEHTST